MAKVNLTLPSPHLLKARVKIWDANDERRALIEVRCPACPWWVAAAPTTKLVVRAWFLHYQVCHLGHPSDLFSAEDRRQP